MSVVRTLYDRAKLFTEEEDKKEEEEDIQNSDQMSVTTVGNKKKGRQQVEQREWKQTTKAKQETEEWRHYQGHHRTHPKDNGQTSRQHPDQTMKLRYTRKIRSTKTTNAISYTKYQVTHLIKHI